MLLHQQRSRYFIAFLSVLALLLGVTSVLPSAQAQELGAQVKVSSGPEGLKVNWGEGRRIMTRLFNIESGGATREAYCIEYNVNAVYSDQAKTVKWDEFPGNNKFKTDEGIRHKVNWIAANSYPAVSIDELRTKIGVTAEELPTEAAIAQTQAAIWSLLADEFVYKGIDTGDATIKGAEFKLFEYLTGEANVGRAETSTLDLEVEIDDSKARREDNGVMGPLSFKTNAAGLKITTSNGTIVDAQGNPMAAEDIRPGTEFYLKVNEDAGEATITASSEGDAISGALVVTPKEDGSHGQTLIVTHNDVVRKIEEFTIRWEGTEVSIVTAASDGCDDDRFLSGSGGTVVDVVKYTGLIVGRKYVIKGELMDKATGEGTGITAEKEFTPESPDGEVRVEFVVPEGYAGKTLVVFERAYDEDGRLVAEHADINDRAQTVRVTHDSEIPPACREGNGGGGYVGSLGFGDSDAGSSGAGAAALVTLVAGGLLIGSLASSGSADAGSSGSSEPKKEEAPAPAPAAPEGQGGGDPAPKNTPAAPAAQEPGGKGAPTAPASNAAPTLANTGASVLWVVAIGLVITAVGAIFIIAKRRRSK